MTGVVNDPLGQNHSPERSDHLKVVLLCEIMKSGDLTDGRLDRRMDRLMTRVKIVITTGCDYGVDLVDQLFNALLITFLHICL